jgi:hypothetical protein
MDVTEKLYQQMKGDEASERSSVRTFLKAGGTELLDEEVAEMAWSSVEIVKEERARLEEEKREDSQRERRAIKGLLDIVEAQVVVCMNFLKRFGLDLPSGDIEALVKCFPGLVDEVKAEMQERHKGEAQSEDRIIGKILGKVDARAFVVLKWLRCSAHDYKRAAFEACTSAEIAKEVAAKMEEHGVRSAWRKAGE